MSKINHKKMIVSIVCILISCVCILLSCTSCITNSNLVYVNDGVCIRGTRPFHMSFFFMPLKWNSKSHLYNSINIDYQEPLCANLHEIDIVFLDKTIHLTSLDCGEIEQMNIEPPWEKNVSNYTKWNNEKYCEIVITHTKNNSILIFKFDKQENKIKQLLIYCSKPDMIQLKKRGSPILYSFPMNERDMLELFGKNGVIQINEML